jgi:hypothetical protein
MEQDSFPLRDVAVNALWGTGAMMVVPGLIAVGSAFSEDTKLSWVLLALLGVAAMSYTVCFVLCSALEGYRKLRNGRFGPPPHGFRPIFGPELRLLLVLSGLALLITCVAKAVR